MNLLFALLINAHATVVKPPIVDWNPHTGIAIDSPWDHKGTLATGTKRLLPPADVLKEVEATSSVSVCKENMSRCEVPVSVPICVDGNNPQLRSSWNIFELWRWRREAVQSLPQRVVFSMSPTLSAGELFLGGGRYQPLWNYDKVNGIFGVVPHPSNVNFVTLGDVLRISGGGRIELGAGLYVFSQLEGGGLALGALHVTEKNGFKYVKVKGQDGKKYGLKLESLE